MKKMKKIIFNKQFLYLACLVMTIGFVASCKKDTVETTDKVELLSFGPTGAKHGEKIIFIGTNLNKVTAVELTGAKVEAAKFLEQTSEQIVFIIPPAALEGYATLKTPDGDVV